MATPSAQRPTEGFGAQGAESHQGNRGGGFLEEKASEPSWKDGHLMGQAGSGRERKERGSEVPAGPVPAWWRLPPPSLLQLPGPSPRPKSPRTASQDELARIELNC